MSNDRYRPVKPQASCTFSTPFGQVSLVWNGDAAEPRVRRIFLSDDSASSEEKMSALFGRIDAVSCGVVDELIRLLRAFVSGEPVVFDLGLCDFCSVGTFQRTVLLIERSIPRGNGKG